MKQETEESERQRGVKQIEEGERQRSERDRGVCERERDRGVTETDRERSTRDSGARETEKRVRQRSK